MTEKKLIYLDKLPHDLLSNIDSRDVALWVQSLPDELLSQDALVSFLGLPWRLVLSEIYDPDLIAALEQTTSVNDPMSRKRGFIEIIDNDPSRIELPRRCLPFYLLNGRQNAPDISEFENRLRRMTILESLRRSGTREILIISDIEELVPRDFKDLWSSGFRARLTFVSAETNADKTLSDWISGTDNIATANLLRLAPDQLIDDVLERYTTIYPTDRHVIRVRDQHRDFYEIDVTEADEPERPILELFSFVEEQDLTPLIPEELSEEDFVGFFKNPTDSWRPYAAGLPWVRDDKSQQALNRCLKILDTAGAEENCIAYVASESGAGGTTLARALAWECAREGYPVLVAKPLPFIPDALPIINFLTRIHREIENQIANEQKREANAETDPSQDHERDSTPRRHETPTLIVFDSLHWQSRDSELINFRNEIAKSGRPVCVLVVTSTILGLSFFNTSVFKRVTELNHMLEQSEARQLGRHLNKFLSVYGNPRQDWQWDMFYKEHTVRYLEGLSAFWVTLSFWIQGQYDLSESIQHWMYRNFKENTDDKIIRIAILEIAALSSERLPLPESLLPTSNGQWPVSHLLEDSRSSLASLGLVHISANGEKHWTLVHDILGRFLINALFYDFSMRDELGFANARDSEHLRFLLLRQISEKPALGERAYQTVAESFATSIFKIDPDRGLGSFAPFWREVLAALDSMPRSLRDTSRLFRHHTAVSRRRIAKLDENLYDVTHEDKISLLNNAIEDINYVLNFIEYTPGAESNLNLFNSLANAYLDWANIESEAGASRERITELRELANTATRKAYAENPANSFVIETYVKNLLDDSSERIVEHCTEALGILFAALISDEAAYRKSQLGVLADHALKILLKQTPLVSVDFEPSSATDVLVKAWKLLAEEGDYGAGMALTDVPAANRARALEALSHPAGQGNMQVIRLSYDLLCIVQPNAFKQQLELAEQLEATDYRMTPQLRLEYAILLFLNSRAAEGEKLFRTLRGVWRDSEQFVNVPERLRWLRAAGSQDLQIVRAVAGSDDGARAMARVQAFGNALVPFRREEFGFRDISPGERFTCRVSFGYKGPFLRPTTAGAT